MWYKFIRGLCKLFSLVFFRYRASGQDNIPTDGAFLLVSNHQSFLDPIFCAIAIKRPLHFLARDSLFRNWFFGRAIRSVNAIPVSRGKADIATMKKIISILKQGRGVCLFPEGTRCEDGRIRPFKPGLGLLCRRGNAAIVPVVIEGAFECWPRHKKIFRPGAVINIRYDKPITFEQVKNMTNEELAELLTTRLRTMQNEIRLELGKEPLDYEENMEMFDAG